MKRLRYLQYLLALLATSALTAVLAAEPIPITADEAFDAVQADPATVALVDVRSRAEYYWVGTAAKVEEIWLKGQRRPIVPDSQKVRLIQSGKFLEYTVGGRYRRTLVDKVEKLTTKPIAISIPYRLWDESQAKLVDNPSFSAGIDALADAGVEVLILFCRSGGRSTSCVGALDPLIAARFDAIYEIDEPTGATPGFGGFEGAGYADVYNGYLGFPGRLTEIQNTPSASWKDGGLPIKIGVAPPALPTP